jgi:hypothetical protein
VRNFDKVFPTKSSKGYQAEEIDLNTLLSDKAFLRVLKTALGGAIQAPEADISAALLIIGTLYGASSRRLESLVTDTIHC